MPIIIKWNKRAFSELIKAIEYIENDSPQNAEKVKRNIFTTINKLLTHPDFFAPDKFKLNNDGTFRAFEIHSYRIAYRSLKNEIRIIRIRHTKRNPRNY